MPRPVKYPREMMLERALDIFWTKGYEATSVHDLLAGLDIHRGTLYDSFGDKHGLYMETLGYYERNFGAKMLDLLRQPGSKKVAIERLFKQLVAFLSTEQGRRGCAFTNAAMERSHCDEQVAAVVQKGKAEWLKTFQQALTEAQQAGELPARTPQQVQALARFLFNTIEGLRVLARTQAMTSELQEVAAIALTTLG